MYANARLKYKTTYDLLTMRERKAFVYKGPITTLIGDWSGTFIDRGSLAPKHAVMQTFLYFGIHLTISETGAPMGVRKDEHVRQIFSTSHVQRDWLAKYNKCPNDQDIEMVYNELVKMQLKVLPLYTQLIPGTVETINHLRNNYNIKVGLTTGFTKVMSDTIVKTVGSAGLVLDSVVAGDEVYNGSRPYPNMLYKNLDILGTKNTHSVVKVDDTVVGIQEGLNAGCWTVGVRKWSTYTGYESLAHLNKASEHEIETRKNIAGYILDQSGAHYIIDDVNNLPSVIDDINKRIYNGERP